MTMAIPAVAGSHKKRRRTRHIKMRQADNLVAACEFAEAIGCRLNVSIDINWLMFSGCTDDARRLAKCQERLSKWFVRRGFALTMIWVREIGVNGALNTHILMHVPPWLVESSEFKNAFERALEPEGGLTHEKAVLINPAYSPERKLRYMLNGMRRVDASRFGVRASFQGDIEGKRVGFTENIGPKARAGWIDAATKLGRNFDGEPKVSGSISSKSQPIGLASQMARRWYIRRKRTGG